MDSTMASEQGAAVWGKSLIFCRARQMGVWAPLDRSTVLLLIPGLRSASSLATCESPVLAPRMAPCWLQPDRAAHCLHRHHSEPVGKIVGVENRTPVPVSVVDLIAQHLEQIPVQSEHPPNMRMLSLSIGRDIGTSLSYYALDLCPKLGPVILTCDLTVIRAGSDVCCCQMVTANGVRSPQCVRHGRYWQWLWAPNKATTASTVPPTDRLLSQRSTKMNLMARPVRYPTDADREAVARNSNIEALAANARKRATELIESDELGGRVDDPLGVLIEEARTSS